MTEHNGPPSASLCAPDLTHSILHRIFRTDFRSFLRKAFYVLYGADSLEENWHLDAIAWALMQVGPDGVLRQQFQMPPRTMKSLIISVFWVAWLLGKNPRQKIWVVSHSVDLAKDLHKTFRDLISHPEIQAIFPELKSYLTIDNDTEIRTAEGGGRWALSVNGNVTGRGADKLILDDPMDAKHANSESERKRVSDWVLKTLWTRMNRPSKTPVVVVMQRLHMDDLIPHLERVSDWSVLKLPAIFPKDTKIQLEEDEWHNAKAGDLLHPEFLPQKVLDERKTALGNAAFSAQYLQQPLPDEGGMIDLAEFRRYTDLPPAHDAKFLSVDSATGQDSGAYTAMIGARVFQGRLYVTGVYRGSIDVPTQVDAIIAAQKKHDIDHLIIENAHAGIALVQGLRRHYEYKEEYAGRPNFIEPITPRQSKEVRMEAMLKYVRAGKILLPTEAPWLEVFENELISFPNCIHKDQVDALSQLIKFYAFFMRDPFLRIHRGEEPLRVH